MQAAIIEHGSGVWEGIGSLPIGANLPYKFNVVMDTRPLRADAYSRMSDVINARLEWKARNPGVINSRQSATNMGLQAPAIISGQPDMLEHLLGDQQFLAHLESIINQIVDQQARAMLLSTIQQRAAAIQKEIDEQQSWAFVVGCACSTCGG